MAVATTLAQLEEVQTAITAVMAGQSYTIGDVRFTRASLSSLQSREEYLLRKYRTTQPGGRSSRINISNGL